MEVDHLILIASVGVAISLAALIVFMTYSLLTTPPPTSRRVVQLDVNGRPLIVMPDGSSWWDAQLSEARPGNQGKVASAKMTPRQFADKVERTGEAIFSHTDFMEKFGDAVRSKEFWTAHVSELVKRGLYIGNATGTKFGPVEISRWPAPEPREE